ncbi:MAG: 5-formyltetrahydrofolate cyclo-ligase [Armatimonadota bacterium]
MSHFSGEKAALRTQAGTIRQTLDFASITTALCQRIAALPEYQSAWHVLIYLAMPDEVVIEGIIGLGASDGKQFYVPRCAPERRLAVHTYVPGETALRPGPFGIREPDPKQVSEADPNVLDLVIVPAVMLSEQGDRLGYGGGYYDRFLPKLRPSSIRIGALPDALVSPTLPRDPWDVPLNLIVTEQQILHIQ